MVKFLVIGTGSNGSTSLWQIFKKGGIECVHEHEMEDYLTWGYNVHLVKEKIRVFQNKQNSYGEIGMFFLPYVITFLAEIPELKVVVLKRKRVKTINTVVRESVYTNPFSLNRHNKDGEHPWEYSPGDWGLSYPKYIYTDEKDIKESTTIFYDSYYHQAKELRRLFPNRIRVFNTECLNSQKGRQKIFDFLKLPKENRIWEDVRINTHEY